MALLCLVVLALWSDLPIVQVVASSVVVLLSCVLVVVLCFFRRGWGAAVLKLDSTERQQILNEVEARLGDVRAELKQYSEELQALRHLVQRQDVSRTHGEGDPA